MLNGLKCTFSSNSCFPQKHFFIGPKTRKPVHQPRLWAQGTVRVTHPPPTLLASLNQFLNTTLTRVLLLCDCCAKQAVNDNAWSIGSHPLLKGLGVCAVFCVSLQILDFGLARQADSEMTGYVVTRWYRAPEVILSWMHYTQTGRSRASLCCLDA